MTYKPYFPENTMPCKCGAPATLQVSGGAWAQYECPECGEVFEVVRGFRFSVDPFTQMECPRCTEKFNPVMQQGAESECPNCGNVYRLEFVLVREGSDD